MYLEVRSKFFRLEAFCESCDSCTRQRYKKFEVMTNSCNFGNPKRDQHIITYSIVF